MKKGLPEKYNNLLIPEALETPNQRLTSAHLQLYQRDRSQKNKLAVLHWTIQGVLSVVEDNRRATPPRLNTEQYWKSIWENIATRYNNAQWLANLREGHSNFLEQDPVTMRVTDIKETTSSMKLDSTRTWCDSHLLTKETNCGPWTSGRC